jgi:hypothetical protein
MSYVNHSSLYKTRSFLDPGENRHRRFSEDQRQRIERRADELNRRRNTSPEDEVEDLMVDVEMMDVSISEPSPVSISESNNNNSPVRKDWIQLLFSDDASCQIKGNRKCLRNSSS